MLHGRTRRDTCRNGKDRRDAADTADGHHEKDAADLTDGRLGGRVTRKEIYETELPHRAVAVYLYLETRADRERTCYPAIGTIARELHLSVSTVKRAIHYCAGQVDYGMVHRGLCRELFTLRGRTEKRKYSWRYETSIYFFGKKLRIEVLPDGLCGDS